jgi:adenylate cyclase
MKRSKGRRAGSLLLRSGPIWAASLVLLGAIVTIVVEPAPVVALRNIAFDAYQRWLPREAPDPFVRIIDIDEASLDRLGQWPWPRSVMATLVERLRDAGASVIAFDIVFAEADRTSPPAPENITPPPPPGTTAYDLVFAEALSTAATVTGYILTPEPGTGPPPRKPGGMANTGDPPEQFLPAFRGAVVNLAVIEAAATGNGAINFMPGRDGIVRRVPLLMRLDDEIYPTLAAEALRVGLGGGAILIRASGASGESRFGVATGITQLVISGMPVATDPQGAAWLHYAKLDRGRYIPAWQVLDGSMPADAVRNRIVFVGPSAAGLLDLRFTALDEVMPGVEIHAQIIDQIADGSYLSRPDWASAVELLGLLAAAAVLIALTFSLGAAWSALVAVLVIAGASAAATYVFVSERLLLDPLNPSLSLAAVFVASSIARHLQTESERKWIREAFASYVSPNLVHHLMDDPGALGLGGERRECSFVMTDLAGFTSLVEGEEPEKVVALLNDYFGEMTELAFRHGGTVEKIVGDAMSVMFSAPVEQVDHAQRAVACALDMDGFSQAFIARKAEEGITLGTTRVGVSSGPVIVGNIGGNQRLDYRALGDAINTAARLEAANKVLGTRVLVSEATAEGCEDFQGRPVGTLRLRGKSIGVTAFEPLPSEADGAVALEAYLEAYGMVEAGDPAAVSRMTTLAESNPTDPLLTFYATRLRDGESGSDIDLTQN